MAATVYVTKYDLSTDNQLDLLNQRMDSLLLLTAGASGGGAVPNTQYDEQDFTYYGATNNIQTQTFKKNGATVATLTYTYSGSGVANDDLVTKIAQS